MTDRDVVAPAVGAAVLTMQQFARRDIAAAKAHAAAGGVALHVWEPTSGERAAFAARPQGLPPPFARSALWAHLFDQNELRLARTVARLGVKVVKLEHRGDPAQHVDLCGKPLDRALAECEGRVEPRLTGSQWAALADLAGRTDEEHALWHAERYERTLRALRAVGLIELSDMRFSYGTVRPYGAWLTPAGVAALACREAPRV